MHGEGAPPLSFSPSVLQRGLNSTLLCVSIPEDAYAFLSSASSVFLFISFFIQLGHFFTTTHNILIHQSSYKEDIKRDLNCNKVLQQ
jgi:hypothetical protein